MKRFRLIKMVLVIIGIGYPTSAAAEVQLLVGKENALIISGSSESASAEICFNSITECNSYDLVDGQAVIRHEKNAGEIIVVRILNSERKVLYVTSGTVPLIESDRKWIYFVLGAIVSIITTATATIISDGYSDQIHKREEFEHWKQSILRNVSNATELRFNLPEIPEKTRLRSADLRRAATIIEALRDATTRLKLEEISLAEFKRLAENIILG